MRLRAVFFEEDDARAAAARLTRDGFEAVVERERLAGEDDDEDHPWAVVSDAPEPLLDLLVEQYHGWLDDDSPGASREAADVPPPLELPDAPRRVKGHFRERWAGPVPPAGALHRPRPPRPPHRARG